MVLEVASDPPVGLLTTTFTLQSSATTDTRSDNNNETVDLLVVDRRPSHTVSVYVPMIGFHPLSFPPPPFLFFSLSLSSLPLFLSIILS